VRRDLLVVFQFLAFLGWAFALLTVVSSGYSLMRGDPIQIAVLGTPPGDDWAGREPGVHALGPGDMLVSIEAPTVHQRWLWTLAMAPTVLLLLITLVLLNIVLHRARHQGPFTTRTVHLLRWMGVVLWAGIIAAVIEDRARSALSGLVADTSWSGSMQPPVSWLFGGFICFAVAEVVRRGIALRTELETVI
jgi:hypothetical protein